MKFRACFYFSIIFLSFLIKTSESSSGEGEEPRNFSDEKQTRVASERRFTDTDLYAQGERGIWNKGDDWKKGDHYQPKAIPISEDQIADDDDRRYYGRKPELTYDEPEPVPYSRDQEEWFGNPGRKSSKNSLLKGGMEFFQRHITTLLIAYKLKFFTLIPLMIGGLLLVAGSTGLAGFFFALFTAAMALRVGGAQN